MDETNLTFQLDAFYNDDSVTSHQWPLCVLVLQPQRLIDRAFYMIVPVIIVVISIQMGVLLETSVLLDLVKRPMPIFIGFLTQYGLMPFLAMAIGKIFRYSPLHSLALFVIGCCPGRLSLVG